MTVEESINDIANNKNNQYKGIVHRDRKQDQLVQDRRLKSLATSSLKSKERFG